MIPVKIKAACENIHTYRMKGCGNLTEEKSREHTREARAPQDGAWSQVLGRHWLGPCLLFFFFFFQFLLSVLLQLPLLSPLLSLCTPPPSPTPSGSPHPVPMSLGHAYMFFFSPFPFFHPVPPIPAPLRQLSVCSMYLCLLFIFPHRG